MIFINCRLVCAYKWSISPTLSQARHKYGRNVGSDNWYAEIKGSLLMGLSEGLTRARGSINFLAILSKNVRRSALYVVAPAFSSLSILWRHMDESVTRAALANTCRRSFEIYSIGVIIKKWNTLTRFFPVQGDAACDRLSSPTFGMEGSDCAILVPSKVLKSSVVNEAACSLSWRRMAPESHIGFSINEQQQSSRVLTSDVNAFPERGIRQGTSNDDTSSYWDPYIPRIVMRSVLM